MSVRDAGKLDPGLEKLDAGEAEAITLANALRADHLLIDERLGTQLAKKSGPRPLSLLAVLDQAATAGLIDIREKLDWLQTQTTYRMTQELAKKLLAKDAERRQRLEQFRAPPGSGHD